MGERRARQQRRPHRSGQEPRDRDDRGRKRGGRGGGRAPGRSGWPTGSTTPSSGSTRRRTPSRRRSGRPLPDRDRGRTRQRLGGEQPRRHGVPDRSRTKQGRGRRSRSAAARRRSSVGNGRVWVSVQTALVARSGETGGVAHVDVHSDSTRSTPQSPTALAPGRSSTRPARGCSTTRIVRRRRGHGSCRK